MKILLTGTTGYIGRRLLPVLVQQGHQVVAVVRDRQRLDLDDQLCKAIEVIEADFAKPESLKNLPKDIEIAFYLIHSMGQSYDNFAELEKLTAGNFSEYAKTCTQLKQIIFLSGIANDTDLSRHLISRINTEEVLRESGIPLTVLRAAIIIGSGGASFEIIRDLVEKLPIMVAPKWLKTRCQPIAIRNVVQYLIGVMKKEECYDKTYDIGGPDILSYKEMLLIFAEVRKLRRLIITVPVLTPRLSSLWLYFVTSTSFNLARSLVESMRNEVIIQSDDIKNVVPLDLISYQEAVEMAFEKIAQNEVVSSWKDALASGKFDQEVMNFVKIPTYGCFIDHRRYKIKNNPDQVLENLWRIGGERGWYYMNFLWSLRGYLDKVFGGVGLRRGRRSPTELFAGDALDFWRVLVANKKEKRLLLYAEMKLPGEAWLEFNIKYEKGDLWLDQMATFRPNGLLGRLYWYSILPFHYFIFEGMCRRIVTYEQEE